MRNLFILLIAVLTVFSCKKENKQEPIKYGKEILGLASPIKLQPEITEIYLQDYFINTDQIDSISSPAGLSFELENDIVYLKGELKDKMDILNVYISDTSYSIPVLANKKVKYTFKIPLEDVNELSLKGNFNGWNPKASVMQKKGEFWTYSLHLFPGEYQYLLFTEGKEMLDPFNNDSIDNGQGNYNSRIIVGNPDKDKPYIFGKKVNGSDITIATNSKIKNAIVLWENHILNSDYVRISPDSLNISIPDGAANFERSHIRIWVSDDSDISNDMLIPLSNGKVIQDVAQLKRTDKQSMRMYFLMVDRFFNGNPNNDKKVDDPAIKPIANYLGGDLEGVRQKVSEGYFTELNLNTVWLSPIGLNPDGAWGYWNKGGVSSKFSGYHGYWPAQSKAVDYRFGNDEDLKNLIDAVHEKDCNILLDYVANHVHKVHPVYKQHPDWATELYLPDGTLNTEKWDEYRLSTWFDTHLPTLDLENPIVTKAMSDSALYWFENFQIDGFRHDATKHIPEIFWRTLTRKLKTKVIIPENRSIYQIGETYGNAELIGSYVSSGQLDAQFDFNLYDKAISVLCNEENKMMDLRATLMESLNFYGYHHLMGNISGNQDRPRFISLADGSVDPGEDTKLAGWTRDIRNNGKIGFQRLAQLHALNFTIPGIPVIYYGDEIGMPGGNDPDNRRMMIFDSLNVHRENLKNLVSKLSELRANHMALNYGDLNIIDDDEFTLIFERRYFDDRVIVVFNNVSRKKNMAIPDAADLNPNFGSKKSEGNGHAVLSLEPHSFEILTKQK